MIQRLALTLVAFIVIGVLIIATGNWDAVVVGTVDAATGGETTEEEPGIEVDAIDPPSTADIDADAVLATLATIESEKAQRIPHYDRELFGEPWDDTDGNSCDTRNDILARDLTEITLDGMCTVTAGVLADPYTGQRIDFVRGVGTSNAVHIDHIVSLSAAWAAGAWEWNMDKRLELANDPANLLAVDGPVNSSKGDRGPADWLPPNDEYACQFVAQYIQVTAAYSLEIPDEDRAASKEVLAGC